LWWFVKLIYNGLPRSLRRIFVVGIMALTYILLIVKYTVRLKPLTAFRIVFRNEYRRGMSAKYDRIDWVGGFPYEFARFEVLKEFIEARGFTLIVARRNTGLGCSELTFKRSSCVD
jgi:2-polyprenyl-6-hydroxyphenyl methylase/3-demethylubiquinone-9 3-methyltransferase